MRMSTIKIVSLTAVLGLALSCGGGGALSPPPTPVLQMISVTPVNSSVEVGFSLKLTATGTYSDGSQKDLTAEVLWSSSNQPAATVDNAGNATAIAVGGTTIQATSGSIGGTTNLAVTPPGLLKNAGLWTQFERRGWPAEYYSGEIVQNWNQFDSVVGSSVSAEVSLQLDKIKAMGVNTLTIQLRTSDPTSTGNFTPPDCNEPPVLGLQFPQPTTTELANLPLFFDMVQSKGMKVWLGLINTHMEQQPPTNSQTWLTAIFGAIGRHPALDLITFDGTEYTRQTPSGPVCGTPAEPPLWDGPTSIAGTYVQWAINFAMTQGLSTQKLSAEAIVGNYFVESQPPANPLEGATDNHFWSPIAVEKTIFDNLNIPAIQRTYALSFYEQRKCAGAQSLSCTDLDPHDWADQTLQYVTALVGSGPRIVAPEMGDLTPVDQVNWNTQHAVESLVFLMHKYGIDGGSFWRWTSFMNSEDSDTTLAQPVKVRGVPFVYNLVQKEIVDMGGVHLAAVPNGLFAGPVVGGVPENWTAAGSGMVSQYLLTQDPGEPEVPSRGDYAMRLVTGAGTDDSVTAASVTIPVVPATGYTTTSNLRFAWTGDPDPTGPPATRPQVFITILYFQQNGTPSSIHTEDTFAYFQEDSTSGFATFPVQYATPSDAALVTIQFGAARNGLPNPITLDVQNVR
jgi:Bacterial Ig-like domain (group 2)